MVSEQTIAQENVNELEMWKINEKEGNKELSKRFCLCMKFQTMGEITSHLSTLRRWLEFLDTLEIDDHDQIEIQVNNKTIWLDDHLREKYEDIKSAIKIYEDAGVK